MVELHLPQRSAGLYAMEDREANTNLVSVRRSGRAFWFGRCRPLTLRSAASVSDKKAWQTALLVLKRCLQDGALDTLIWPFLRCVVYQSGTPAAAVTANGWQKYCPNVINPCAPPTGSNTLAILLWSNSLK